MGLWFYLQPSASLTEEPALPGHAEAAFEGPQPRKREAEGGVGASPRPADLPRFTGPEAEQVPPPGVGVGGASSQNTTE